LIEGAHTGRGLGISFLRHAMRTRVLIHLLDGSSASPLDDMIQVNNELARFDSTLAKRPQVVAINKVDLPEVQARVKELKSAFAEAGITPVFISAVEGTGLTELKEETWKLLQAADASEKAMVATVPTKVFHPRAVDRGAMVRKKGHSYILADPAVESLLDKINLDKPDDVEQFNRELEKLGINKLLKLSGVKNGDTIITGSMEWEWQDDEENRRSRRNF